MDLSVLIPARNEMFLSNTIENVLENIQGDTEIIVVCDGNWTSAPIEDHPRLNLIYHNESIGQRAATNEAARLSQAKFIMKLDAHCCMDKGFDVKLMADCEYDWTVVPRMHNLHVFNWKCKQCGNETYQGPTLTKCEKCSGTEFEMVMIWKRRKDYKSDYMWFDTDLKFSYFDKNFLGKYGDNISELKEKYSHSKRDWAKGEITDQMTAIGACWMMHRERYWELGGLDEDHGSWGQMGTEIACKSWLSGGRQVINKKTWFAHMFRTQGGDFGFPYPLKGKEIQKARDHSKQLWKGNSWPKAIYPLSWLIDKFSPLPGWDKINYHEKDSNKLTKGVIYYTDNNPKENIFLTCQKQIEKCMEIHKLPIVSVSQKPINFGRNIVMDLERSVLSMYKQILKGLEESETDIIFMLEHDLLYHPSHFDFTPKRKDTYYYDRSVWSVCADTGKAVFYHRNVPSLLCAYRDLLIEHYKTKVDYVEKNGYKSRYGFSPPKGLPKELRKGRYEVYFSKYPSIDIRHSKSLTRRRMDKSQFRSERSCRGWTEADEVYPWGKTKNRFDDFLQESVNIS